MSGAAITAGRIILGCRSVLRLAAILRRPSLARTDPSDSPPRRFVPMPVDDATPMPPADLYRKRLEGRRGELDRLGGIEKTISFGRLGVMVVVVVTAWLGLVSGTLAVGWTLAPLLVFVGLVIAHRVILRQRDDAQASVDFYEAGLGRLDDRWAGHGKTGTRYLDPDHLYAGDLDLFGPGSLFELLAVTRTRAGDDRLAAWLLHPATPEEILGRQAAVAELAPRSELREELFAASSNLDEERSGSTLVEWAQSAMRTPPLWLRGLLLALAAGQVGAAVLWAVGYRPTALLALLLVQAVLTLVLWGRFGRSNRGATEAGRGLRELGFVLEKIESETFTSPLLTALQEKLLDQGVRPSERIARLHTLLWRLDSAKNLVFSPIAILLVWSQQVTLALESWRSRTGSRVGPWIEIAGEVEALAAIATYSFENPDDPFPSLDTDSGPRLEAEQLGHPLLARGNCVRNDIRLGDDPQALIVSGSNMSGKSTALRTVGINVVLAQAGAPVRAERLRLSPLAIGASITIQDSLREGHSKFYREILRVRDILELSSGDLPSQRAPPTLFLFDEILHGTNSHDRRIGAQAILGKLLDQGAVGLVTTHDLALAAIADQPGRKCTNVHFEDEISDGLMHFDYRLRPGVVEKSNAIELMRQVGLEIS